MNVYLKGISYHLPSKVVSNDDLVALNPTWEAERLFQKTGIRARRVAGDHETSLDLGEQAARSLLTELDLNPASIDALLFCTQTPDFLLPASSCILHERLKLATHCGTFDFNLGCSGFTYGLWLAKALVASQSAKTVLLVVADTLSKECRIGDQVTVPIFGDGAGAAIVSSDSQGALADIRDTLVGTDGRGWEHLKILGGASRYPNEARHIEMNGAEIFNFTLGSVTDAVYQFLNQRGLSFDDIDRVLLHQANGFILNALCRRMKLTPEKCPIDLENIGNTSSASLPILFRRCLDRGDLTSGDHCILVGYGVGYSWSIASVNIRER